MILWWLVCLLVAHGSKWFPVISAQVEKSNQFDDVCNDKNVPTITKGKDGYCKGKKIRSTWRGATIVGEKSRQ